VLKPQGHLFYYHDKPSLDDVPTRVYLLNDKTVTIKAIEARRLF
jgi:hypothetical protein